MIEHIKLQIVRSYFVIDLLHSVITSIVIECVMCLGKYGRYRTKCIWNHNWLKNKKKSLGIFSLVLFLICLNPISQLQLQLLHRYFTWHMGNHVNYVRLHKRYDCYKHSIFLYIFNDQFYLLRIIFFVG